MRFRAPSKRRHSFNFLYFLLILVQTITIDIYFENLFEFFVSDKQNGCNHEYHEAFYFLHAFLIIALETIKKKTTKRASHFRKPTFKNQEIATKHATKIYKCICRPLLKYGHQLFLNCRNQPLKIIKTAGTISLRRLTKLRHPNTANNSTIHRMNCATKNVKWSQS